MSSALRNWVPLHWSHRLGGLVSSTCSLHLLDAALDAVLAEPLSAVGAVALAERARRLQIIAARLDAALATTLVAASSALEAPEAMRSLGYRTPEQYVTDRARVDGRSVRAAGRLGRWLLDFPVLAQAFEIGGMSSCHLNALCKITNERTRFRLVENQQFFVDTASACDFNDFTRVVQYWLNAADPDGAEPRDQVAKTGLWYRRHHDGALSGRFFLDPLTAQAFRTALENESQRLFRADAEGGTERHASRRDAAAMVNLVLNGTSAGASPSVTPLVHIVMSESVAEGLLARLGDPSIPPPEIAFDKIDGRCEFIDGTPLHPNLAVAALAAARLRRVILDADAKPVDVSVRTRGFPPWMKHLLLIQARGRCRSPGCDAPFPWLQADHIQPVSAGGATVLSNGQILCDPHNKWKGVA